MLNVFQKLKNFICFDKNNSKYNSKKDKYDELSTYTNLREVQEENRLNDYDSLINNRNSTDIIIDNLNSINFYTSKDFNYLKGNDRNLYKDIYQESKSDEENDDSHEKLNNHGDTNILIIIPLSYLLVHVFTLVYLIFIRARLNLEVKSDLHIKDSLLLNNYDFLNNTFLNKTNIFSSNMTKSLNFSSTNDSIISNESDDNTFINKLLQYLSEIKENIKVYKIYDFYSLMDYEKEFVFVSNTLNSIISFVILYLIFSLLKQRFNVPEYKVNHYNLYAMFLLGIFSCLLNFMQGFYPLYVKQNFTLSLFNNNTNEKRTNTFGEYTNEEINSRIDNQSLISLKVLMYTSFIIISILYSLSVIANVNFLKKLSIGTSTSKPEESMYFKYFIILMNWALSSIYIFLLINKNRDNTQYIENSKTTDIIFALIPYFLYLLHGMMMFCFYYDIKYVTYNMKKNIYVDFLFENESIELLEEEKTKF